jgi:proprotein convertase subtilisin/kexin type 2
MIAHTHRSPASVPWTNALRPLALLLLGWLLAACSSGGGGGNGPTNLAGTEVSGGIQLNWDLLPNADSYNIYAGSAPGFALDDQSLLGSAIAPPVTVNFLPGASGTFVFVVTGVIDGVETSASNSFSYQLVLTGPDPFFTAQWHLKNTGQGGGTPGEDANCEPAWNAGATGDGVLVAIVDNGLQIAHPDLSANVVTGSHNYQTGGSDPGLGDHGTCCGGIAAAAANNGVGVRGAAYDASLVGYGLLNNNTNANSADAMLRNSSTLGVSSNSWGPTDGTGGLAASPQVWRDAIDSGVTNGRGGRGVIYTWAAGNGAFAQGQPGDVDNSNYDGFANYYGVISVAAVGDAGTKAFYSEKGANVWISAPSMGDNNHGITTTDLTGTAGYSDGGSGDLSDPNYTENFNGTSAACPLVTGVAAQMLEANPNLTWSDVRIILAETARQNDPLDGDWSTNGAGYHINHSYGFGVLDAGAAVAMASTWTPLPDVTSVQTNLLPINLAIPDNNATGVSAAFNISGTGLTALEYVHIFVDAPSHTYWPDLEISIESPSGTVSLLAEPHPAAGSGPITPALSNWRFGSARHLGEPANGTWTLRVRDMAAGDTGTLVSARLQFFGR